MDLIERSNLNRQLLFRDEDIGNSKAEIAAKRVHEINPNIKVNYYTKKLQEISNEIYSTADIFVSGLDNIPARIFLNQKSVLLKKPMIDGGSEGFYGHVQVVLPHLTPCLLCHDIWSKNEEKFKCSYAVKPRTPIDCVLEGRDQFFIQNENTPDPKRDEDVQEVFK